MSKTVAFKENNLTKAYNIASVGDNDAEISMYGEVVSTRPVDWWTGEPMRGNFIAVDEFLADLESIKDKDNVTVHINSVGGDLHGGLSIYNRLKGLKAHVTTIVDGIAASAASLIFLAGKTRKVNAGSSVMIHGASKFMYGLYNVQELMSHKKSLEAHNKTAINAYVEATGRTAEEIKAMMDKTTWLAGQEAVDAGFADEVITSDEPAVMSLSPNRELLVVNGVAMSARSLGNIPLGIPIAAMAPVINQATPVDPPPVNQETGGKKKMEIKNLEEMRAAYPEFCAQLEESVRVEAMAAGAAAERKRIEGIENIQNAIGDAELVKNAKFGETTMSAEQLAFQAMQAQAAIGATVIKNIDEDAESSKAKDVQSLPNDGNDDTTQLQDAEWVKMLVGNGETTKGGN